MITLRGGMKKTGSSAVPKFGGSSGNALQNMMMAQIMLPEKQGIEAQGAAQKQQATQPIEVETDTQKAIRRKASEDALKIGSILPVLKELKERIRIAYSNMKSAGNSTTGIEGGVNATKEYFTGVVGRKNPELRSLIGQMNLYRPQVIRAAGDSGNFSVVEQVWAGKAFPKFGPNWELDQAFMADDPNMSEQRVQDLHDLFNKKYMEAVRVAETGEFKDTGYEKNPKFLKTIDHRKLATEAIQKGADAKKVAAMFKQETGEDL